MGSVIVFILLILMLPAMSDSVLSLPPAPPTPTAAPTSAPGTSAPPGFMWSRNYPQNATDYGMCVEATSDGGYIATGFVFQQSNGDIYLVKTNSQGNVSWSRSYDRVADEVGYAVRQTTDGGYIVAGTSGSSDMADGCIYLLKTDSAGNKAWDEAYWTGNNDQGYAVLQTSDSGYLAAGISTNATQVASICLIKTDSAGEMQWSRNFGTVDGGCKVSLQPVAGGGYIVAATHKNSSNYSYYADYAYLAKIDSLGNKVWDRTYLLGSGATRGTIAFAVQSAADGGYVVTGRTYDNYRERSFLLKTDASGNVMWARTYGVNDTYSLDVQKTRDGGYAISGVTSNGTSADQCYLAKTDSNGNLSWQKAYLVEGGILMSAAYSVRQTADDGYIMCGLAIPPTQDYLGLDVLLLKTDASGGTQWTRLIGERSSVDCRWARQIADGGYILTGNAANPGQDLDIGLTRLDPAGNVVWRTMIGGQYHDEGRMVIQAADGGFVVAGGSIPSDTSAERACLAKVAGNGQSLWSHVYGDSFMTWAYALTATSDGGYALAGGSVGMLVYNTDAYLVKTDADGNEQWNMTYATSANERANYVIQTADGGYLLVGQSRPPGTTVDSVQVYKVDSTGSKQWSYNYSIGEASRGSAGLQTADGGYIIAGAAVDDSGTDHAILLKINSIGSQVWCYYYGETDYTEGASIWPAFDGGYVIGGTSYDGVNGTSQLMALKTDASGRVQWEKGCPVPDIGFGTCAQQTADGGYIVAGYSVNDKNVCQPSLVKLSGTPAPQTHKPIQMVSMPAMLPGHQQAGGIMGRVTTTNTSAGVAGASVYVVNASNASQYYWQGTTNDLGYFQLASVSNTWDGAGYQPRYRVYAYDSLYGESYSNNFTVEDNSNAWAAVMMIPAVSPGPVPTPPYPGRVVQLVPAPAMQGPQDAGAVVGRATTFNTTVPIANAFVAVLNASNMSQAYYVGYTDQNGYFSFAGINNTYDPASGNYLQKYKAYVNSSRYGEGFSNNFSVEPGPYVAAWASVIINPVPAKLSLAASRYSIVANASDYTNLSVYVTDADGAAVSDNTPITFWVNQSGWSGNRNGWLSVDGSIIYGQSTTIGTVSGYANLSFGWVDSAYAGNYSVVNVSFRNNASMKTNLAIAFRTTPPVSSHRPVRVVPAPAMVSPYTQAGGVTGRVTSYGSMAGTAGAYVAIVNASNTSEAYYVGQTNAQGFFQLPGVNNTWDGSGYKAKYKLYADGGSCGVGYSNNFTVEAVNQVLVNVVLRPYNVTPWEKSYGGAGYVVSQDLRATDDGGYVIAAYGNPTLGADSDMMLIKADANGNIVWNRTYNSTGRDFPYAVLQTSDGGYIIAGKSQPVVYKTPACLIKTDACGMELWRVYRNDFDSDVRSVVQSGDGGYVVTGERRYEYPANTFYTIMYLMKTDASGNVQWEKDVTHTMSGGEVILKSPDGGYVAAGGYVLNSTNEDVYLVKTDESGNLLWSRTYGGPARDYLGSASQTADGGYVIWYNSAVMSTDSVMHMVRTDSAGNQLWSRTFSFTGNDCAEAMIQTADGGYVASYSTSPPYGTVNVMKLDTSGALLWNRSLGYQWGEGNGIVQSSDGGYVTSGDYWSNYNTYMLLAKVPDLPAYGPLPTPPYPGIIKSVVAAPAMQGPQVTGDVTGRLTTFNTTSGIPDTFVAIIDASNYSQAYYVTRTDAQGYYRFLSVNQTYSPAAGSYLPRYKIYVNNSSMGEGYSNNFSVEAGATATALVIVNPIPAHIYISPEATSVVADGFDKITVSAYVTDVMNNPVADNTPIMFKINDGRTYNVSMGSWSGSSGNTTIVGTASGYATATFGWVPGDSVGLTATITISDRNPAVRDSTRITFEPVRVSWSGSVLSLFGSPACNVPVVLHVCGPDGELYTRSTRTLNGTSSPGTYSFDDIPLWPNVTYAYASVNYTENDDISYLGHTDNYLLNKSHTTADPIALQTPVPYFRSSWSGGVAREDRDFLQVIYRHGDSSVPVSVQYVYDGGTAVPGVDFTTTPALPCTLDFGPGDTQKLIYLHVNPGSAGKYAIFRQANASGAIADHQRYILGFMPHGVPDQQVSYPNMSTNTSLSLAGGITGRVTTYGTSTGIADTDVWIVNASNTSQYFSKVKTNAQGFFQMANVNNTWVDATNGGTDPGSFQTLYRAYCYDSVWGENYSYNFTVEMNSNVWAAITIDPKPAHIAVTTSKSSLDADETDSLTVSVLVTDALNNPVNGSVPMILSILPGYAYNATNMGKWDSASTQSIIVDTNRGYANATYGWVSSKTPYDYVLIIVMPVINSTVDTYGYTCVNLISNPPPTPDITSYTYNLKAGWNMISVPVAPMNDSVLAFFPADVRAKLTDMWYYDHGSWVYYSGTRGYSPRYPHLNNVTPGKGYWVKLSGAVTFTVSGEALTSGVPAAGSGWTMIGVNGLSSLNTTTAYPSNKNMWYYDNGQWYYYSGTRGFSPRYPHIQSLDPGKGYWVNY